MTKLEQDILQIENMICIIRGQKVMQDSDLARLYGVETKVLNRQVKRNLNRFPADFMFQLTEEEMQNLRCQFGTSSSDYGGRRYNPFVFSENGVAMLSSVLSSERAIEINIAIMRTFTKLRSFLAMESSLNERMGKLEVNSTKLFKTVFTKLDSLEEQIIPRLSPNRKKIGLKNEK
ncbi:MAG: ORF6N domain-containing protein [Bacteriovorax sp.]|nr:ORF6N domain-containing protein [Bacteriovorax sp.]